MKVIRNVPKIKHNSNPFKSQAKSNYESPCSSNTPHAPMSKKEKEQYEKSEFEMEKH